jgi:starch synthase
MVSRFVEQKGIDLLLEALPSLMSLPLQIIVLGSGEAQYEQELRAQAKRYPEQLAVLAGYDEAVAHHIQAGADCFLMPSRFEPCGLSQLYSLRYGTVPIVRRAGGLADTVVDASTENIAAGTATGIVFENTSADALTGAVRRALSLYAEQRTWKQIQLTGMRQDFSWHHSAAEYLHLYEETIVAVQQQEVTPPKI